MLAKQPVTDGRHFRLLTKIERELSLFRDPIRIRRANQQESAVMRPPFDSNDSVASFIGENLTIFQSRWLRIQSEAVGQTRNDFFEAILREWFLSASPVLWATMGEGEIARLAVEDFISRHYLEFLPVPHSY